MKSSTTLKAGAHATEIALSPEAVRSVYQGLARRGGPFAQVLEKTEALIQAGNSVRWRVPVLRSTVYRLEALFRSGKDIGAELELHAEETLSSVEYAFLSDFCRNCLGQERDSGRGLALKAGFAGEVLDEAWHLGLALPPILLPSKPVAIPSRLNKVLIIGAYGGDHVGDSAILGGVLLTLHRRYGVTSASLLSFRAQHTRRMAAGLSTPVEVTVHHYDPETGKALVDEVDAVVIAGGPLMDFPRVLVKHLIVANEARRQKKPLIIERVGLGPFRREASRRATRVLAQRAAYVSTRTLKASQSPILKGLDVKVGRDPAFDYLETRKELTRLTAEEKQSADDLLTGSEGHFIVGINVRPIEHTWSSHGTDYVKTAEDRFSEQLAEGMRRFVKLSSRPVTFVFFAMNPIQFGMSDLASAYRLFRLVGKDVDLRVWEADPDVDGLLYLLRRMNATISVRFHACIFSISQGLPTIGADYYPGGGGKVKELFSDLQLLDNARVMDEFTADWVAKRLQAFEQNPATVR